MQRTASAPPRRQNGLHSFFAVVVLLTQSASASTDSLQFPLPASAAACPSFYRYARLHRAALGNPGVFTGLSQQQYNAFLDVRRVTRHHHQPRHHARSSRSSHSARRLLQQKRALAADPDPAQPLSARSRARWVVTADPDGIADRLVNAVSSFYFALLTDRVLCIQPSHATQPGLQAAFATPHIDWTCGGLGPADSGAAAAAAGSPGPPLEGPDVAFWNPTEDDAWLDPQFSIYHTFIRSNLNTVGPVNATTILLRMHRGITVGLFNNPHHRQQMETYGLRPDTAFGCAVQFLFGLNMETRALASVDPGLHAIMVDDSAIKIGIQIRLGDDKILEQIERQGESPLDDLSTNVVNGFLGCAQHLAASVAMLSGPLLAPLAQVDLSQGHQQEHDVSAPTAPPPAAPPPPVGPPLRIYLYLMTDTLAVRRLALERFGSQLLTMTAATVQFFQNVTDDGLRRTALEHWYFSRCHHHIITGHSGMGRTAAFAGLRPGPSLFSMEVADGSRLEGRGCGVGDADRPMDVYNTWSGV